MRHLWTAVLACLVLGSCASKPILTAVQINAPPSTVWAILTDFERYPEWNPTYVSVIGEAREGARLQVQMRRPDGKIVDIEPEITRLAPDQEMRWGGGVWGVYRGKHVFVLEDNGRGGTRFFHNEDIAGVGVMFADLPRGVLTEGYHRYNVALKARAESLSSQWNTGQNRPRPYSP